MFQYKSNDTKFTQYNQVLVALFIRSKFALDYAGVLFLETDVVLVRIKDVILKNSIKYLLVALFC
jgi:hypothetical protein